MKVLVTGSGGFVGKEVVKELKRKKHTVIEFDFNKGKNILNKAQIIRAAKPAEAVIHLAGIVENTHKDLWKVNVDGTMNVSEAAGKTKTKKFVFLSSTGVYGNTRGQTDENSPLRPENLYEKSKAEGEKICIQMQDEMSVCIVRGAMVFGSNAYWKKMFEMLLKNYPLPCSGKNTFQVIYVKELARAVVLALEKGKSGEIYLAAGKEKPTLNEFCEMAQEEMGITKGVKHILPFIGIIIGKLSGIKELTGENIRHLSKERNYNTKKIESIGWKQKSTLKQAIKEVASELELKK